MNATQNTGTGHNGNNRFKGIMQICLYRNSLKQINDAK